MDAKKIMMLNGMRIEDIAHIFDGVKYEPSRYHIGVDIGKGHDISSKVIITSNPNPNSWLESFLPKKIEIKTNKKPLDINREPIQVSLYKKLLEQ